jgi:hypothetical protein
MTVRLIRDGWVYLGDLATGRPLWAPKGVVNGFMWDDASEAMETRARFDGAQFETLAPCKRVRPCVSQKREAKE